MLLGSVKVAIFKVWKLKIPIVRLPFLEAPDSQAVVDSASMLAGSRALPGQS